MLSIIVPIYNCRSYLQACVESVLQQTEPDLRLILVDDGSTDGSGELAKQLAKQDKRIVCYTQPHAGQSVARNLGLQHAEGQYIAFLDADDMLDKDWCARHLAAIDGVDYVQSGCVRTRPQQPRYQYQFTSPCMRLYRREAIEGLRFPEGMIYEDVLFSTDLWLRGSRCRIIDYAGYRYTVNPDSTTAHPHPEAQQRLFDALRAKRRKASLRGRLIIDWTILRLTLHFKRI